MMKQNWKSRVELVKMYLEKINLDKEIKDYYKDRTIYISGGAGAIGSNLVIALSLLVGENGKIISMDNFASIKVKTPWNSPPLDNVMFVEGDIRSDSSLKRVFKERPSLIFHLACFFANQNSVDYPEESADVDIMAHVKILEYANLVNIDKLVYASSGCAIYGSYPELPLKEDFISMHLTTPYQINKMVGEMYNNFYMHHYELPIVNCRFFNSYGPGEVPGQYRNVIPNFIYWAMKGQSLPITGEGNETRDFTFVLDLVQGLIKAGFYDDAVGENFNLAAGKEISVKEMAEAVNKTAKNQAPFVYNPRRKWDTKPRLLASIEKAERLIRYEPIIDFKEGFNENIKWFNENWNDIELLADFKPGMSSAVRKEV